MTPAERRAAGRERQERYRRHNRGDHAVCLHDRAPVVATPEPSEPFGDPDTPEIPTEAAYEPPSPLFGDAGRTLWAGMLKFGTLTESQRVLLREACRMADRLDELDTSIGDNKDDLSTVKWLLRECRQQAIAMKNVLGELRMSGLAGDGDRGHGGAEEAGGHVHPGERGPGIADLSARIAARLAEASG